MLCADDRTSMLGKEKLFQSMGILCNNVESYTRCMMRNTKRTCATFVNCVARL